jgi:hypothetical protein
MKKLVKCEEVEGEGLLALLGKRVVVYCSNYIYTGTLLGVNDTCILLGNDVYIVFETGDFSASQYKDAQKISKEFYIQCSAIESFGISK